MLGFDDTAPVTVAGEEEEEDDDVIDNDELSVSLILVDGIESDVVNGNP